jgi:hypothetical protein
VEANVGQESETTPIDPMTVLDVSTSMKVPKLLWRRLNMGRGMRVSVGDHQEMGFGGKGKNERNEFN